MNIFKYSFVLLLIGISNTSCNKKELPDEEKKPLLEVEGKFLYKDDVQDIIPPNVNSKDSSEIAQSYIRKWVTTVLMYENAKRNITNQDEIDELVESYRKSLIIHQYQQKLIVQRLPKEPAEEELKSFYEQYSEQLKLNKNIIKGLLLIVPTNAPKINELRSWVKSGNTKSLENIEKYSLRNAISYDYFGDKWLDFSEILKRIPLKVENPASYIASNRVIEISDSLQHYFLRIESYKVIGQVEPYEMARDRIINILTNKNKADLISNFEKELYDDAIKDNTVNFIEE